MTGSPFHIGEQQVQERLGVREIETWARRAVRAHMPDQHRTFYEALPFLVASARDAEGRVWATVLTGDEGFVTSPDARSLRIDAAPMPGDALEGALREGADLGLLGIEFSTRRRNRANGEVFEEGALLFRVKQSFGNCPQHIQPRAWRRVVPDPKPAQTSATLSAAQRAWVAGADTLFIGSGYRGRGRDDAYGMDASHRGGPSGFVRVKSSRRLVIPDYSGNNHFNTIGNLALDPRVGLLFVDFATGSMLQLTGKATMVWDGPEVETHPDARRLIVIDIERVVELPAALPLRWDSPGAGRRLRVLDVVDESTDVRSFVLASDDGQPLPDFEAGQHVPLAVSIDGEMMSRTYSLSNAPGEGVYRITVKRHPHGRVSQWLHDRFAAGAVVTARPPAGDFVLPDGEQPLVLVSAGVGITPMVSMLRALVERRDPRRVYVVHGARDEEHHALGAEVAELVGRHPAGTSIVTYSRPRPGRVHGRIDDTLLGPVVEATPGGVYLLCGPVAFMRDVAQILHARGVPAHRIHTESFGPS